MGRVMDEQTFGREWVAHFGPMSSTRILGWIVLTRIKLAGREPTRELLLREGWGSTATRYRNVGWLVEFRDAMEAKGWTFEDAGPATDAVALLRAVV